MEMSGHQTYRLCESEEVDYERACDAAALNAEDVARGGYATDRAGLGLDFQFLLKIDFRAQLHLGFGLVWCDVINEALPAGADNMHNFARQA